MVTTLRNEDLKAVMQAEADASITVIDWSEEERAAFRTIAVGQWLDFSKKSENAEKVYWSVKAYLEANGMLAEQ